MSYSVYLTVDTGGTVPAIVAEVGNIIWNAMPMYYKAFGPDLSDGFKGLHGRIAREAVIILRPAIARIEDNRAEYEEMNPKNGWGSYEGALELLRKLLAACLEHPKAQVDIS